MTLLYNIFIQLLLAAIHLAALFDPKAKKWVVGRRNWRDNLKLARGGPNTTTILWVHVSSLGEFEQGRPIIEQFRHEFPQWRIVLTFFSPSGFEIRKSYPLVDVVAYLPADTRKNAREFLELLQPDAAIFVKYDFWANYLFQLKKRDTPTLLVSALFRPSQPFFKWYGGLWRQMLSCFSHIFVQNHASAALLQQIGFQSLSVAGDTRVDRVLRLAADVKPTRIVEDFVGTSPVIVAGSTWEKDEQLLFHVLSKSEFSDWKIIVAPHDPLERNVERVSSQFGNTIRYSLLSKTNAEKARVLIIDNVGLLNTLYQYGTVAYIGGGFGKGIHNTLEPAAFGLPIIFGSNYMKFEEARQFVARGGAFSVRNADDLFSILQKMQDLAFREIAAKAVLDYLRESKGATDTVLAWLRQQFDNQSGEWQ